MEQQPINIHALPLTSDNGLIEQVNRAFKSYHSMLALSRSALANSPLVLPALVRDEVSPTADERGHALRLVLRWAVSMLAPEPAQFPIGVARPLDDPTWRDPRWWRYNILRHRYIEPLHPDEFVAGGRYTETLIALTGIANADSFFEERNRAVREAATWLRQQRIGGAADHSLRQLALEEIMRPLRRQAGQRMLLEIAATFEGVFPRVLLLQMAEQEHIAAAETALAALIAQRLLRSDADAQELWLSPALQTHLAGLQSPYQRQARHQSAAHYYQQRDEVLAAARHLQQADHWEEAAERLLSNAGRLIDEFAAEELYDTVLLFPARKLAPARWLAIQMLIADLASRLGRRNEALAACRRALRAAEAHADQAAIYRRMAKLYEQINQRHALHYYQQAAELLPPADPQLAPLYKDRAWIYILRREWLAAEADLQAALAAVAPADHTLRAAIYDAFASLYREQRRLAEAIVHAQRALAIREEHADLPQSADSHNNLGLLYNALGETSNALAAFEEALSVYRQLNNPERTATALLNIGMTHHLAERRREAIQAYEQCLTLASGIGLQLVAVRAHYNLAEAHAECGDPAAAAHYLAEGRTIARDAGFDDEVRDLENLAARFGGLIPSAPAPDAPASQEDLSADEQQALLIAARLGHITPRLLMSEAHVSKATATRRLSDLARRGLLQSVGRGRATAYVPSAQPLPDAQSAASSPADQRALIDTLQHQAALLFGDTCEGFAIAPLLQADRVSVLLRFRRLPDLHTFFAAERRLSELLARSVDLLPADAAPPELDIARLDWISLE